jgi:methionyl-tRNA formyltransferase
VFMGTPDFAVPSLELLLSSGCQVVAVVTAPDKPRGRGQELSSTPVKEVALRHHLPVLQPESLKEPAFVRQLDTFQCEIIVVVAFRILPREVFTLARVGAFNLHASLLPRFRGAAPINWAIIRGETETGVTTFLLEDKVDTGGILLQSRIPIGPDDDAGSLHDRLSHLGAQVVLETTRLLEKGSATPRAQDHALATPAPKIFRDDCHIRWEQSAENVRNFIRGLSPSPAAFTRHRGKLIKIYRVRTLSTKSSRPAGEIEVAGAALHVATADHDLAIEQLQLEGRARMGVEEFLRGYRLTSGDRFS